ncbi:hypothetical protein HYFRA_00000042 [Hymenoscyphus fraxineus]|uniref:Laccase n=1 Tax=Hymenoscyphus fraxineus TaxID=746836 RepID=A0A9N9L555_9HELO|nr:hypothetical protein HYFRA_00000042 [Hymenoscyphus fraxineus]
MRFSTVVVAFLSSLAEAQNSYARLAVPYLVTADPVTPLPQGAPWGTKTANNTNPYPPATGVIRKYDFTIRRQQKAPDGFPRDFLTINGQFPGPLIEANWGDTIQVTVHNSINSPEEGTGLHWHGILQKGSPWMDGVPGVTQCPIPPGGTFTYSFIADLYGSSWYHSHYSGQYASGLLGPMIIHGPDTLGYDVDIGPILLTDHYHRDYFSIVKDVMSTDVNLIAPASDNNLINGRNNFDCSTVPANQPCAANAGISNFKFTPGKTHRLRLINAGAEAIEKFSIDGHTMTVIANDFVPINPYDTQVVTLGIGQRTDVLVKAVTNDTKSNAAFIMRSSIAACSLAINPDATAIVYYGANVPSTPPTTQAWPAFIDSVANQCANDPIASTTPIYKITPDPNPPTTQNIAIGFGQNATQHWLWTMNSVSFRANYNQPILLLSSVGNNSYPANPEWNVYNFGSNSSVRIVIENPGFAAHPMHLHGHNMHILNVGTGTWDGTVINPANTQRRDVQLVPAGGYLVLQFEADNPGAWPLHCHIAWHVSGGLYVTVVEKPDEIAKYNVPSIMAQTCRDWTSYTNSTLVEQIDSGL